MPSCGTKVASCIQLPNVSFCVFLDDRVQISTSGLFHFDGTYRKLVDGPEEWHSSFHETNHLFVSISSRFCSDLSRGRLAPEYITAKHRREVWDQVPELIKK